MVLPLKKPSLHRFIMSFDGVQRDYRYGKETSVYHLSDFPFALLSKDAQPLRLSLRCDPHLAKTLRERYETILPGQHLDQKNWNTILITGQLSNAELKDLVRHAYEIAKATESTDHPAQS